ncbi:MAG TPA: DUF559 domain-containing protein [Solirubrobacterales bacterium]|nr:DUF559 domain-containing protein [Solirubrobacterales bacterium]
MTRLAGPGLPENRRLVVFRSRHLETTETAIEQQIPVTSVARTLLDLAGVLSEARLRAAFNEADRLDLLEHDDLMDCVTRGRGWKGAARFRRLVGLRHPKTAATRSELESVFLGLCADHGLEEPRVNTRVCGMEVDCFWPSSRLVVELDGVEFHRGRMALLADADRDLRLRENGFEVLRFTHPMVTTQAERTAALLRDKLARTGTPARA